MCDIACTVWSSLNSIAIIAAGPSRVELTMIEVVKIEYKWDKRMAVFLVALLLRDRVDVNVHI